MKFRAGGIEGLRGLAALAVVVFHTASFMLVPELLKEDAVSAGQSEGGLGLVSAVAALGAHGVTVFFVISGFLLYRPFVAQVSTGARTLVVREFLRNRLLRIFPAYLVVFLIAAFGLGVAITQVASDTDGDSIGRMTDPLLILTNLTLTQGYLPQGQITGLGVSWSLVPEIAFYLLLPVIWVISRRLATRLSWQAAVLVPVLVMLVVGFSVRVTVIAIIATGDEGADLLGSSSWLTVVWHSLLTQGDLFALGMLVAVLSVHSAKIVDQQRRERDMARTTRRAWWLLGTGVVLAIPARIFLVDAPLIGMMTACVIWIVVFTQGRMASVGRAVLEWRPVARAGLISYSLYLWHVPVIFLLRDQFPELRYETQGGLLLPLVIVVCITWVLSELTYALVERPAMEHKRSMFVRDEGQVGAA